MTPSDPTVRRIAVCTPAGRDASLICSLLRETHLDPLRCDDVYELCKAIANNIGAIVVAEEALYGGAVAQLEGSLARQPEWSDLPIIVLTKRPSLFFDALSSATYVERPVHKITFIRQVLVSLRSRGRQYQIRDYIREREEIARRLEHAKNQAERANASKSAFLAAASHDLRQPMQAITLLQAVLAKKVREPELQAMIAQLGAATSVIKNTLDALLDINQLERGRVTPQLKAFRVGDVTARLYEQFVPAAEAKGVGIKVLPCRAVVRSDPNLFERILHNLVANAIKYTPAGRVLVGCRRRKHQLRIEVWDSGIGIREDQLAAIFDEFHQVDNPSRDRNRGTGLGLSMAQRLAQVLGLELQVRSTLGKGSVFFFTVPLWAGRVATIAAREDGAPGPRPGLSILLLEDDELAGEAMKTLLEADGYQIVLTQNLAMALSALASSGCVPDAIIADYNLGAITGPQAISQVRAVVQRELPALVLTGDIREECRREVLDAGFQFLAKPVPSSAVLSWIESVCGDNGDRSLQ